MSAGSVQSFSLRTKLLVFAAVLVIVPGAIYGAITVVSSRAALTRVVGRQLVAEARNAADRLASTLRFEQSRLESYASQDVMREIRIADFDKRISSFLSSAKRGCPACADLLALDRDDRVVSASNPAWIGKHVAATPGRSESEPSIEGPLEMQETGEGLSLLRFSVPIPDPDDHRSRLGRLIALVDWERGTEVIAHARRNLASVGLDADVLIVDAGGRVIGGAAGADTPWQRGRSVPVGSADSTAGTHVAHVDADAGMLFGDARLAEPLPPWRVVVGESLARAFAPIRRTLVRLAGALGVTLAVALAIALFAARRTTRPLVELTAAAEQVGLGGGPVPIVPQRSGDELGVLTAAFNRMSVDLRRAERELVDAAKFAFVGELAAGVAHEVRTPLGVLRSSAQLLERSLEAKDAEARELCEILRSEVDRIERVVSQLLELGRPRELRVEPTALGAVVFRAADFVEAQAREKGVVVRRERADPDPEALCDPDLVYQVALNLLVNAVQIVSEGGSVEARLLAARDGRAGFEVRDDGPGMSDEVRKRIFEPFFTRRNGGTGLGLTFVQRVVQEHRGRVSVESTPGHGAVFRVELPTSATCGGSGEPGGSV